jgi:hypothetical protein
MPSFFHLSEASFAYRVMINSARQLSESHLGLVSVSLAGSMIITAQISSR